MIWIMSIQPTMSCSTPLTKNDNIYNNLNYPFTLQENEKHIYDVPHCHNVDKLIATGEYKKLLEDDNFGIMSSAERVLKGIAKRLDSKLQEYIHDNKDTLGKCQLSTVNDYVQPISHENKIYDNIECPSELSGRNYTDVERYDVSERSTLVRKFKEMAIPLVDSKHGGRHPVLYRKMNVKWNLESTSSLKLTAQSDLILRDDTYKVLKNNYKQPITVSFDINDSKVVLLTEKN